MSRQNPLGPRLQQHNRDFRKSIALPRYQYVYTGDVLNTTAKNCLIISERQNDKKEDQDVRGTYTVNSLITGNYGTFHTGVNDILMSIVF